MQVIVMELNTINMILPTWNVFGTVLQLRLSTLLEIDSWKNTASH